MVKQMISWKSKKLGDILLLVNGVLIIVLVNLWSARSFFRIDLTEEKRYTIKAPTRALLESLEDVVYVEVFLEGDMNAEFRRLRNAIRETLEEFRIYSGNKVQYKFTDPASALSDKAKNEFIQSLVSKGIQLLPVYETRNGERVEKVLVPGAVVAYGGNESGVMLFHDNISRGSQEVLNQSIESAEYELARAIQRLSVSDRKRVGIVKGHGEADSIVTASFRTALATQYDVVNVALEPESLAGCDLVVIVKPVKAFSESDKFHLDQFVMNGGKLLMFVDQMHASMDSASRDDYLAIPYETGLQDQLFKYGVRVNYDLIQDRFAAPYPVVTSDAGGKPQIMQMEWPFFPLLYMHADHVITRNSDAAITKFISSVDTVKAVGVHKVPLLFSSQASRKVGAPVRVSINDLRQNVNPESFNEGPIPVAWLLEGTFTSLYKNRFLPESVVAAEFRDQSVPTSMIIVGDGEFVCNDVNPRNGRPQQLGLDPFSGRTYANEEIAINMVTYLLDGEGLITARNKNVIIRPLDKERVKEERTLWQFVNIGLPLVLVIAFGMVRGWLRKKTYSRFG